MNNANSGLNVNPGNCNILSKNIKFSQHPINDSMPETILFVFRTETKASTESGIQFEFCL